MWDWTLKLAGRRKNLTSAKVNNITLRVGRPWVPFTATTFSTNSSAASVAVAVPVCDVGVTANRRDVYPLPPMRITLVELSMESVMSVVSDSHCTTQRTVAPYKCSWFGLSINDGSRQYTDRLSGTTTSAIGSLTVTSRPLGCPDSSTTINGSR